MSRSPVLPLLGLLAASVAFGGDTVAATYPKWSAVEIELRGPELKSSGSPNPFAIRLDVRFTAPSGKSYSVPGFFDGDGNGGRRGDLWKVRFAADELGTWNWASDSDEPALDNRTGRFEVANVRDDATGFRRWGRLEAVGTPQNEIRYLRFRDGPYWLKAGCDDPENFLGSYSEFDTTAKRLAAVDYLAQRGINSLYIMTHNLDGDDNDVWPWLGDTPQEARSDSTGDVRFDVAKLHEWRTVFERMQSLGVVPYLILEDDSAWKGYDHDRYYREIIARFGDLPAVVFNLGEEHNENYTLAEGLALARRFREIDPYDHPLGIHNVSRANDAYVDAPELDLTSIQTGQPGTRRGVKHATEHNQIAVDWIERCRNRGRRVLVVNFDEGRPEHDRRAWWSAYLAGGVWEAHVVGPYDQPLSVWEPTWTELGGARAFMESLPFAQMQPRNELVVSGTGFCLAKDPDVYAFYLPEGGTIEADLPAGDAYVADWWNPENGYAGKFQDEQAVDGGRRSFSAPSAGDWALRVRRRPETAAVEESYFPPADDDGGWRRPQKPDDVRRLTGLDVAKLDKALDVARRSTKNGGLLVLKDGWLVYERYFGLGHRDATPNLASCGKSFTSICIGILMQQRPDLFPEGLDQRVFTPAYFPPEAFPLSDPSMADIRLGQLLAFTAGIRGNNPSYVDGRPVTIEPAGPDGWQGLVDEITLGKRDGESGSRRVTASSLWCPPGGGYSYATASIHNASIMLRHVTGAEMEQFIDANLAEPLGWGRWGFGYRNARDVNHTPGGGGIALRATDMLRFGYLLLQEGRWAGRQLVPADYVRHASTEITLQSALSVQLAVHGQYRRVLRRSAARRLLEIGFRRACVVRRSVAEPCRLETGRSRFAILAVEHESAAFTRAGGTGCRARRVASDRGRSVGTPRDVETRYRRYGGVDCRAWTCRSCVPAEFSGSTISSARESLQALRGKLAELTPVVGGELPHVPEPPRGSDFADPGACPGGLPQFAAHAVEPSRRQVRLRGETEMPLKRVTQSALGYPCGLTEIDDIQRFALELIDDRLGRVQGLGL